jgi:hypothetical protein
VKTWTISNPSGAYTMHAPDLQTAAAAVLMLGEGYYGAECEESDERVPIFLLGGLEEWLSETFPGGCKEWVAANRPAVADALDSVMIGGRSERVSFDEAMRRLPEDERAGYRHAVHELNDIGARAWRIAKALRVNDEAAKAKAELERTP